MIKIFATGQGETDATQLDVIGTENINITYSVDDVMIDGQKQTSYSKDFLLPATKRNNQFFQHYYHVDIATLSFDASRSVEAFVELDGVIIIDGYLQLIKVQKKESGNYYNVVIFDTAANLINELGDDTLSDLTFEGILHRRYRYDFNETTNQAQLNVDYNNMPNSWTANGITTDTFGTNMSGLTGAPSVTGSSTAVLYPMVYDGNIGEGNVRYYAQMTCFPLSLQLKYVLDTIFSHVNFTVESDFFDTADFKNIYFSTRHGFTLNTNTIENLHVNGLSSNLTLTNTAQAIPFNSIVTDIDNEFTLSTTTFTAHDDLNVTAAYQGVIQLTQLQTPFTIDFVATITDSSGVTGDVILDSQQMGNSNPVTSPDINRVFNLTGNFQVTEGSTVVFKIKSPNSTGLHTLVQQAADTNSPPFPYHDLVLVRNELPTPADEVTNNNQHIKLVDLVRDVFKLFNLVAEPNGNRKLIIEPYIDFVNAGSELDWTNKTDLSKSEIKPLTSKRSITLKYAEDSDDYFLNKYKEENGEDYGSFYLEFNPDGTSDVNIELEVFAPAYVEDLTIDTNIGALQHVGILENGDIKRHVDSLPRLFYKNFDTNNLLKLMDLPDTDFYVYNAPNNIITHDTYQSAYIYSDSIYNLNSNSNSLGFGVIQPYEVGAHFVPTNTLFNRFYFDYVQERYDTSDSFLYVVYIHLKATDIFNFTFRDAVIIKGQKYRVNKIEYNTSKDKLAKVELYRI